MIETFKKHIDANKNFDIVIETPVIVKKTVP